MVHFPFCDAKSWSAIPAHHIVPISLRMEYPCCASQVPDLLIRKGVVGNQSGESCAVAVVRLLSGRLWPGEDPGCAECRSQFHSISMERIDVVLRMVRNESKASKRGGKSPCLHVPHLPTLPWHAVPHSAHYHKERSELRKPQPPSVQ